MAVPKDKFPLRVSSEKIETLIRSGRAAASAYADINLLKEESILPVAKRLAEDGNLGRDSTVADVAAATRRFLEKYPAHKRSTGEQAAHLRRKGLEKTYFPEVSHEALRALTAPQLLEFSNTGVLPNGFLTAKTTADKGRGDVG